MRLFTLLVFSTTLLGTVGCSNSETPATVSSSGDSGALGFNPELRLKWPGKPEESNSLIGGEQFYSANYTDKRPEGLLLFAVNVIEYQEKALKELSPKELMAAFVFASQKNEVRRTEIEHGPRKHPGLEILTRSEKIFSCQTVVMADRRLYSVSVSGPRASEHLLSSARVKEFFDSFVVE